MATPLKITMPGPAPYKSDKMVPWNYGADVYYHGIKQDLKNEEADTDVINIAGTSKVTRSGRVFSLEIAPKIIKPTIIPTAAPTRTPDISPVTTLVIKPATTPVSTHITTPVIIPAAAPVSILIATPTVSPIVIPATESAETRGKEVLLSLSGRRRTPK